MIFIDVFILGTFSIVVGSWVGGKMYKYFTFPFGCKRDLKVLMVLAIGASVFYYYLQVRGVI